MTNFKPKGRNRKYIIEKITDFAQPLSKQCSNTHTHNLEPQATLIQYENCNENTIQIPISRPEGNINAPQ